MKIASTAGDFGKLHRLLDSFEARPSYANNGLKQRNDFSLLSRRECETETNASKKSEKVQRTDFISAFKELQMRRTRMMRTFQPDLLHLYEI